MRYVSHFAAAAVALSVAPMSAVAADQLFKLLPTDGAAGDYFGECVEISGTTAIVGARLDADNGSESGSAYLFNTTTGQQTFKLLPTDGAAGDRFGYSVAISGTTAIVGAMQGGPSGARPGAAYLFDTTTGQQTFKLLATDGAAGDQFGYAVAISGTTAIVGALSDDDNGSLSGSAYLFDTTTGQQLLKLLPTDGAANDLFGHSVAISGTTAIVGALQDGDNGSNSGSAYLFDTTTGQQLFKILPTDGAANDFFSVDVAISGTTAIVGAYKDDDNGADSGSAYLFDATTGLQTFKLLATDGAGSDWFGTSVEIDGTTAIVGSWGDDDNGADSGSAYLFNLTTGRQTAKLLPTDGAAGDNFGRDVEISGTTVGVSAYWDDDNGDDSGSAYLFGLGTTQCVGDLDGDGDTDVLDFSIFASDFGCGTE